MNSLLAFLFLQESPRATSCQTSKPHSFSYFVKASYSVANKNAMSNCFLSQFSLHQEEFALPVQKGCTFLSRFIHKYTDQTLSDHKYFHNYLTKFLMLVILSLCLVHMPQFSLFTILHPAFIRNSGIIETTQGLISST